MSFFKKLVDETQISAPPEATRHHNSKKLLLLLPLRADLLYILHYETPCRWQKNGQIWSKNDYLSVVIFWEFAELAWGLRLHLRP